MKCRQTDEERGGDGKKTSKMSRESEKKARAEEGTVIGGKRARQKENREQKKGGETKRQRG